MSINKVILAGNLGKDPDLCYTPSGLLCVVSHRRYRESLKISKANPMRESNDNRSTKVVWRNLAEICGKYRHKGKQIYSEEREETMALFLILIMVFGLFLIGVKPY